MDENSLASLVAARSSLSKSVYTLRMVQEPQHAKVHLQRDKDRKPLEPPPVVEFTLDDNDPYKTFLSSPHYYMFLTLHENSRGELSPYSCNSDFSGTSISAFHRVKDTENNDVGYFVFQDLSIRKEGEFRLKFSLCEIQRGDDGLTWVYLNSVLSKPFKVYSSAKCPPPLPSTFLTKHLQEQGVKLRTKKSQKPNGRRSRRPEEWSSELPPQSNTNSALSRLPVPRAMPETYQNRFAPTYNTNPLRREGGRGLQAPFDAALAYGEGFYGQSAFPSESATYRNCERGDEINPNKRQRTELSFPEVDTRYVLGSQRPPSHSQGEGPVTPHSVTASFGEGYFSQHSSQTRPHESPASRTPLTQPRRQYAYTDYNQCAAPDLPRGYQGHLPNRLSMGSDVAMGFGGSTDPGRHRYASSGEGSGAATVPSPMHPPTLGSSRQSPVNDSKYWPNSYFETSTNTQHHRRGSSGSAIPPGQLLPAPPNFQSRSSMDSTMQSF